MINYIHPYLHIMGDAKTMLDNVAQNSVLCCCHATINGYKQMYVNSSFPSYETWNGWNGTMAAQYMHGCCVAGVPPSICMYIWRSLRWWWCVCALMVSQFNSWEISFYCNFHFLLLKFKYWLHFALINCAVCIVYLFLIKKFNRLYFRNVRENPMKFIQLQWIRNIMK